MIKKERLIFDPDTKLLIDADVVDVIENGDGTFSYDEVPNTYVVLKPLGRLFRPMLVDGKVVEGKTEDEFLEEEYLASLVPSQEEAQKAEFEIKVLTLLEEMGMF